jgi:hypothetical protein
LDPAVGDAPFTDVRRRTGIVGRVLSSEPLATLDLASLRVHVRPAARTATLFGEEGLQGRDRIDLPPA